MKSNLNSLKQDEDRKATQHETVKGELREQVHDEIKQRADIDEHEKAEIESVAHELKHKAIHEVSTTEQEVTRARQFARILDTVTYPLVAPFRGLMPDPRVGNFQLMLSYVIGLIVYALIHFAIKGLIRLMAQRPTVI